MNRCKLIYYLHFYVFRIDLGDKFTSSLSDAGELVLQIANFSWSDVGEYKAHIENQFGVATRIIKMDMSGEVYFIYLMFFSFYDILCYRLIFHLH